MTLQSAQADTLFVDVLARQDEQSWRNVERDAEQSGQKSGAAFGGAFRRNAAGKLIDEKGRFVKEGEEVGEAAGRAAGRRFSVAFNRQAGENSTQLAGVLAGIVTAAGAAGVGLLKLAGDAEQTQVAFTTLLGSGEKAKAFLTDLQKFAANTPFEFNGLADSAKRLLAFGFSAQQIIPMMTAIGDAVGSLGGGKDVLDGITTALGQIQAKGKVSAEEMAQMAERGIPVWDMLAKKIGVSIPEAMKLAEDGAISATQAIPAILLGMQERFGGGMAAQSKTLMGMWSNTMDTLSQAGIRAGQAIADGLDLKTKLAGFNAWVAQVPDMLAKLDLKQWAADNSTAITVVSGALIGALVPALIAGASAAIGFITPLLPFIAAGAAITLTFKALGVNFQDVTRVIGSVVKGDWTQAWTDLRQIAEKAVDNLPGVLERAGNKIKDLGGKLGTYLWEGFQSTIDGLQALILQVIGDAITGMAKNLPALIRPAFEAAARAAYGAAERNFNDSADHLDARNRAFATPYGPQLGGTAADPIVVVSGKDLVTLLGMAGRTVLNAYGVSGKDYHHDGAVRADATHNGIDYGAPRGSTILAPFSGMVTFRSDARNGNVFDLVDAEGQRLTGIHLDSFNKEIQAALRAGAKSVFVEQGTRLGTVGNTGTTAGSYPHLHLMAYLPDGTIVDATKVKFVSMKDAAAAQGVTTGTTGTPSITDVFGGGAAVTTKDLKDYSLTLADWAKNQARALELAREAAKAESDLTGKRGLQVKAAMEGWAGEDKARQQSYQLAVQLIAKQEQAAQQLTQKQKQARQDAERDAETAQRQADDLAKRSATSAQEAARLRLDSLKESRDRAVQAAGEDLEKVLAVQRAFAPRIKAEAEKEAQAVLAARKLANAQWKASQEEVARDTITDQGKLATRLKEIQRGWAAENSNAYRAYYGTLDRVSAEGETAIADTQKRIRDRAAQQTAADRHAQALADQQAYRDQRDSQLASIQNLSKDGLNRLYDQAVATRDQVLLTAFYDEVDRRARESKKEADALWDSLVQAAKAAGIDPDDRTDPNIGRGSGPDPVGLRGLIGNVADFVNLALSGEFQDLPENILGQFTPGDFAALGDDVLQGLLDGLSGAPGWEKVTSLIRSELDLKQEVASLVADAAAATGNGFRTGNERPDGDGTPAPGSLAATVAAQQALDEYAETLKTLTPEQLKAAAAIAVAQDNQAAYNLVLAEGKRRADEAKDAEAKLAAERDRNMAAFAATGQAWADNMARIDFEDWTRTLKDYDAAQLDSAEADAIATQNVAKYNAVLAERTRRTNDATQAQERDNEARRRAADLELTGANLQRNFDQGRAGGDASGAASILGVASAFGSLLSPLNLFAQILERINPVGMILEGMFSVLAEPIKAIQEPLKTIGTLIGSVLAPLFKIFAPILKAVVDVIVAVYDAIAAVLKTVTFGLVDITRQPVSTGVSTTPSPSVTGAGVSTASTPAITYRFEQTNYWTIGEGLDSPAVRQKVVNIATQAGLSLMSEAGLIKLPAVIPTR
ncbi:tape measure protein [Deinococcus daejeonensis]|uniref:Uncharacterized protein n=1 Tax=Deinococcus daejeonensis TaxID=1007098 RepID=A0ABQ2IVF5_9DEIO|nr:tape measure protein [Deinococcus daejeonensis]GGN32242.1 hypothetical protein GCM10010842_08750 [Deinococcus daejeonensis]